VFIAGCCCSLTLPCKTPGLLGLVRVVGGRGPPGTIKQGRAPGPAAPGSLVLHSRSRAGSACPCATDHRAASPNPESPGVHPTVMVPEQLWAAASRAVLGGVGRGWSQQGAGAAFWLFRGVFPLCCLPRDRQECCALVQHRGPKLAKTLGTNQNIFTPSSRCRFPPGDTSPVLPGCPRGKARL